MPGEIVRDILARFGIDYDKTNFVAFYRDVDQGVKKVREFSVAWRESAKAQKEFNAKQLAAESKQLAIEHKKLAIESRQLAIANQKKALSVKDLTLENKKLANQMKEVKLAQQKARGERYEESLRRKKKSADALSKSLSNVRDSMIAIAAVAAAKGLFNIALQTERMVLRIRNLIDRTALADLEKKFEVLNKQAGDIFSIADFEEAAAAVFLIDRNVNNFAKTMEFAVKMAPVLGKSLREVQEGIARGAVFGDEESLIQLGMVTPLAIEEMRRRTGLSLSDLLPAERLNYVLNLMKLSAKQIGLVDEAAMGLGSTWKRFTTLISNGARALSKDFKPVAVFLINSMSSFLRMLSASPVGVFVLRLGGLVAGVAALALGLGVLAKSLIFLKGVTLSLNAATALLMAKYLLWGVLITGLIILLDDLWLSAFGPKDADTLLKKLATRLNKFFKDIGLTDFIHDIDNFLADIVGNTIDTIDDIAIKVKNFLTKGLGEELNKFFDGIGFTKLTKDIDKFLEDTVDKFFSAFNKVKDLLKTIGIGPEAEEGAFSFLPEAGGTLSGVIKQPGSGLTPPGRQLLNQTSSFSTIDNSTSLTFGGSTLTVRSGLNKNEIINAAMDAYRRDLERELNEADIGVQ